MEAEGVVLPAPAVGQSLGLSCRGEQLGVEEFVSEPAVEPLGKAVLPRESWLDVASGGAAGLVPALKRMGNELGVVIAADESRRRVDAGELLQHRHHELGLAAPAHPDGWPGTSGWARR